MLNNIKQKYNIQIVDYYVFLIFLFALPFGRSLFSPFLFLWFILVLVSYIIKKDFSLAAISKQLFILVLYYLVFAFSSMLTTELKVGLSELQFKLPFLLVPLLYPAQRESYKQGFTNMMIAFVIGCVTASLYLWGYAAYRSFSFVNGSLVFNPIPQYGWNNYFLGTELSPSVHPSYLSLFILFALLIVGFYAKKWWAKCYGNRVLVFFSIAILIACLIMLQSRAGFLGFGLISITVLIYLVFAKRKYFLGLFILFVIGVSSIYLSNKFYRYSETIKSLQKTANSGIMSKGSKEDGTAIRFWIWKSSVSVIEEHPICGALRMTSATVTSRSKIGSWPSGWCSRLSRTLA